MGRKGVSKRKESKTKSKPLSVEKAGGAVSLEVKAAESQPVKALDTDKVVSSSKSGGKPASDSKKKAKKG
ncbi:MAG TPA: hypothetical protein VKF38_08165 [Anaerolineaceae bacterium]|nr:hypothetical protein [Anaerolineaceae bacterium]